ncbi:hypothetical protein NDU88_006917 [Pleurodeles waltl]|uniref:Uncharacterized protein n=1 Tax=Pleurodeles waltl TaxID=8319 RepID=A0AAV7RQC0_PLEWA|nr:hypothetical protein NDU88_006917 [Pleurodeles waltl]
MGKSTKRRETAQDAGGRSEDPAPPREAADTVGDTESPSLGDIMQAITSSRESLEHKIDTLALDLGLLREDQRRLAERVAMTEKTVSEIRPQMKLTVDRVAALEKQVGTLVACAEDAENRPRRNNIRIVGLPETNEQQKLSEYLKKWIQEEVAPEGLT